MVLIKQEFIKHGWEIRNEFEFDGNVYYDAVKDSVKLEVIERGDWQIYVAYKQKGVSMVTKEATWEKVVQGIKKSIDQRIRNEDAKMEKALSASKKRKEKYEKAKRTIDQ